MPNKKKAILLVNLGTPDAATPRAVRRYLAEFLSDPFVVNLPRSLWLPILYGIILLIRPKRSAKLYQKIWLKEGSPLLAYSQALSKKLTEQTQEPVTLAMRYGKPSLIKLLKEMKDKFDSLLILPLFPQYSTTTTESIIHCVKKNIRQWQKKPRLNIIHNYHDHPAYVEALAEQVKKYRRHSHIVFSFHGIPQKLADSGDPYEKQCQKTGHLLAQKLGLNHDAWDLAFQSRFGGAKWLQPYCQDALKKLAESGKTTLDIICPGFAVDCLETLEEIEHEYAEYFKMVGGEKLNYIPALNDSNEHVNCLKSVLETHEPTWQNL